MAWLGRNGQVQLSLTAGQSLAVGSFGPGDTRIYTAGPVNGQVPPIFGQYAKLNGGAGYYTFAAAATVLLEAANGCEVEYDYGAQPSLSDGSGANTITAFATGGQASATLLTANHNRITVCATAADSVKLPAATVGKRVTVYNAGAASCNVFPQTGESTNSGSANAAFAVAATKSCIFNCGANGIWTATLSA
jgi:hypothetical protein